MTGISPISWQQEIVLSHLRNDAKEVERLHKYHGPLTPEWVEHMKESVARLQKVIDAHVLQPVPTRLSANEGRSTVAVALPEEQAAGRLRIRDPADVG